MVLVLALAAAVPGFAQDEKKGPVLYGDGGGRIWKWESGEKTWLTPEGQDLTLGGVGEKELWGWASDRDRIRFFTLPLPQKKDAQAADPKAPPKAEPPAPPVLDAGDWPAPDRADRVGDRVLLVYGALSGHPRYEVWQKGQKLAARAWDDGRVVYALALGRDGGWILAGRSADAAPWLEVSGAEVPVPEGWRGRLTVAAWVPEEEKKDEKKAASDPKADPKAKAAPKAPPPVHPWAAGWGAPGTEGPRALFWGPDGWIQPAPADPPAAGVQGTYPILGLAGDQGTLTAAGWQADDTGALRPWFWDGKAETVAGGTAEGQPQAFSLGGKGGAFLVVRHEAAPWFTREDGKDSVPLEGLGPGDRVVAVEAQGTKTP
jgi:hypothetical protein